MLPTTLSAGLGKNRTDVQRRVRIDNTQEIVGFFIDILYHAWTLRTMTIDNNCDDRFSLANWKTESSRTAQ